MRLIIISNRLPVKISDKTENYVFTRSAGGLATGLGSLETRAEKHWIGWPGIYLADIEDQQFVENKLGEEKFHPVFLTPVQIQDFYEGYSNSTIWPLCHYFYSFIEYNSRYWEAYNEVNRLYCEEALKVIEPGDTVWIQDYQLMLLPAMLREKMPGISIGYFHHIPFPSYELFRVLPERAEILRGLMGADLIGFHTPDYMRHFISAAYRVLGLDCQLDEISYNNRVVHVDSFPMGINFPLHYDASTKKSVQDVSGSLKSQFGDRKMVLSVDRLDYSKGIIHRLKGFEQFLENHPEYLEKVSLAMVVVPSRDTVEKYADLKTKIDETIGAINGKYSTLSWRPVFYFYKSFPFDELMALYYVADIALVTPLRDGMNLVAKEYVAVKRDQPGILILSEMAGAAVELSEAIIINPNDADEIEASLVEALSMPEEEQLERLKHMQGVISRQTVNKWAANFVNELNGIRDKSIALKYKLINEEIVKEIQKQFKVAKSRLIVLDYDGTLVPLVGNPKKSLPGDELLLVLEQLAADPHNKVLINSGRDPETLDRWLGHLPVMLAAEHGAFYKEEDTWISNVVEQPEMSEEILNILQYITEKTPGSYIETKKTSLVWHYRKSDAWLADLREKQLIDALMVPCSRLNLQIMRGNKVVEVKTPGINKGMEVNRLLEKFSFDFILAMGDDITDEDMFHSLPADAITIKVGSYSELARFSLSSPSETLEFLRNLAELGKKIPAGF